MIHLQELWFSSSKVMICLFTSQLYTKLQIGNHNFELSPSTWGSVVTGWDHSDFMSWFLDIKSPSMLCLLHNLPIINYFQSYLSCHYPLIKSRKYYWNIITSCVDWKEHTCEQALLVPYLILDLEQIVDVSRWFWKRLSTILKRLKSLTLLKSSIVSDLCRLYSDFKDFVW